MANKTNIFQALPQHVSDSEDEVEKKPNSKITKKDDGKKNEKSGNQSGNQNKDNKGDHVKGGKDLHHKKDKVPEEGHHNKERQSGTGKPAYDKKLKKEGAGKANWGSNKHEGKDDRTGEGEETENVEEEPKKPEGITLEEYFKKTKAPVHEVQVNEAKNKVISEQVMKELLQSKATQIVPRSKNDVNEKTAPKKKTGTEEETHLVIGQQQHGELLNFRTGFVEREFRERKEGEKREFKPREEKREKPEEKVETTKSGEEEEREKGEEGEEEGEKKSPTGYGRGNRRGGYRGGNRGDRGGYHKDDSYRNDNYRKDNYKGGYKSNNNYQPKPNIDESAFPKLG